MTLSKMIPEINNAQKRWLETQLLELVGEDEKEVIDGTNLTFNRNIVKNEVRAELRQRIKQFMGGE